MIVKERYKNENEKDFENEISLGFFNSMIIFN